ncbi:MAG TPA: CbiX/SirB N-terminal domain-containing protein [Nocardioides sp.]|uniref:sirohydrochlorin chelatase n=1 Tax=Nocardioides sp. TaxID=35761 RepID=UPI002EDB98DB
MTPPRLVTVAHGTRTPAGNRVAAELTRAAGAMLSLDAQVSYVELCEPLLADVLAASPGPTVVVPLLLSTGYHVRQDLPRSVAAARSRVVLGPVVLGGPLGPDPLLAAAQVERLREAGARAGQPVTMVAAGSEDATTSADLTVAADLLGAAWGAPVRLATLAGRGSRMLDVVRPGDAVSPYLLAPGFFADRAHSLALHAGAGVVAEPIGPHPLVIELVARRAESLLPLPQAH